MTTKAELPVILFLMLVCYILLHAGAALADGTVYTGAEKTIKCDNPTERTDGTPMAVSEIDRVEIFISQSDQDLNPPHTVTMSGGCADTVFDLTQLNEGQYYMYGVTWDKSDPGRVSALSASLPFMRSLMNPNAPVMVE